MIVVSDTSCVSNLLSVGRAVALREGLAIIGLVGILLTAKRSGFLDCVSPVLDQLATQAGFRLSESLKLEALRAAGEAP